MTKTLTTICLDAETKERAMYIIQNKIHSSLSREINLFLEKFIQINSESSQNGK
jgi:antitoxin component of RelBE/YafQ-DinJ toxin-antitoxin module